jgi:acyl carrier protein
MVTNTETEITRYIEAYHTAKRKGIYLTRNTLLLEEKILDSLGMLELITFVEATFNIEVPDEDIVPDHFGTIEKLARYIESNAKKDGSNH